MSPLFHLISWVEDGSYIRSMFHFIINLSAGNGFSYVTFYRYLYLVDLCEWNASLNYIGKFFVMFQLQWFTGRDKSRKFSATRIRTRLLKILDHWKRSSFGTVVAWIYQELVTNLTNLAWRKYRKFYNWLNHPTLRPF